MQITVVGLGYVGLVTATCLARLGQEVIGLEADSEKLRRLERNEPPFFEPGLDGELAVQRHEGRLRVTSDASEALRDPEVVLICVGTPSRPTGEADLRAVDRVIDSLARELQNHAVIALRSTVPVGTTRRVEARLNEVLREHGAPAGVPVFANPEFLRTGRAMEDFLRPWRVVLGRTDLPTEEHTERLLTLYRPLDAPTLVFDAESAELVKNAANAYLATRISFINELAALCERAGASIDAVIAGIAGDPRIGGEYLRPGLGYGGSCLPKDVRSLMAMGIEYGVAMRVARAVDAVNQDQPNRVADRLAEELGGLAGRSIGILGLAFKAETDDIRDSPALSLARALHRRGATVRACDPQASAAVAAREPWIEIADGPAEVAEGADAVVLSTEWPEYVTLDLRELASRMARPVLLDARNALDPKGAAAAGLRYLRVGTPAPAPEASRPSALPSEANRQSA
ncbi:MAG TPA: UDP-glucose/GDP-mannose dehydrogenase family protein [candidate division Zixibacteria bacterium]|nr:UDP-glucose/GDP-mannose dehydrogenase family protein [candidate division Zixibacteria bacterium]